MARLLHASRHEYLDGGVEEPAMLHCHCCKPAHHMTYEPLSLSCQQTRCTLMMV